MECDMNSNDWFRSSNSSLSTLLPGVPNTTAPQSSRVSLADTYGYFPIPLNFVKVKKGCGND